MDGGVSANIKQNVVVNLVSFSLQVRLPSDLEAPKIGVMLPVCAKSCELLPLSHPKIAGSLFHHRR